MQNIIEEDIKHDFRYKKDDPSWDHLFYNAEKLIKHILPSPALHVHRSTSFESQKEQENILEIHF